MIFYKKFKTVDCKEIHIPKRFCKLNILTDVTLTTIFSNLKPFRANLNFFSLFDKFLKNSKQPTVMKFLSLNVAECLLLVILFNTTLNTILSNLKPFKAHLNFYSFLCNFYNKFRIAKYEEINIYKYSCSSLFCLR